MSVIAERLIKIVEDIPNDSVEQDPMKLIAYLYKEYVELYGDDEETEQDDND